MHMRAFSQSKKTPMWPQWNITWNRWGGRVTPAAASVYGASSVVCGNLLLLPSPKNTPSPTHAQVSGRRPEQPCMTEIYLHI